MSRKKIIGFIFQLPLVLVVIASFIASIYAIVKKIYPISWVTPFLLGIIIILYFIGSRMKNKKQKQEW